MSGQPEKQKITEEARPPMGRPLGENETLLVHNARPVDVVGRKLFDETALVIRGGKIEQRLPAQQASETAADRKIDAGGRYVIPGLINGHCHMTVPGILAPSLAMFRYYRNQLDRNCVDCVTHGVTTVRDMGGPQHHVTRLKDNIERGYLMGPRILRGIAVQVPGGYGRFAPEFIQKGAVLTVKSAADTRDAVARAVDNGADFIKLFLQYISLMQDEKPFRLMTDEMLAAAVEKAASLGKRCAVHHSSVEGHRRAIRAGIQSVEHVPMDGLLTDDDLKKFIDEKKAIVPTHSVPWTLCYPLTGDENFDHPNTQRLYKDKLQRMKSHIEEFAAPQLVRAGKGMFNMYTRPGHFDKRRLIITPSAKYFNREAVLAGKNMINMYKAGCRMGVGNDGGVPFVWPGSIPLEMYLNQLIGIKPADVLYMATAVNSEIISMDKSLGTLDAGKIADMVMYDANPLESMDNLWKPAAVLQSGRLVHTTGEVAEATA